MDNTSKRKQPVFYYRIFAMYFLLSHLLLSKALHITSVNKKTLNIKIDIVYYDLINDRSLFKSTLLLYIVFVANKIMG
jgi:hypothetical protein